MGIFSIPGLAKSAKQPTPICANAGCRAKSSKKTAGVWLAKDWFCGLDCFEQAARKKIGEMMFTRQTQDRAPALRMPLGLLLVSRDILTHEQLKIALEQQRNIGGNLGEIVQELGFANEQQVTSAVAAQWASPVFNLGDRPLPSQVHIPRPLLEQYAMLPVHYSPIGKQLMVAFVSRVQHHMLSTIDQIADCSAKPCFITASEFRRGLQHLNLNAPENEVVFENPTATHEISGLVRNYVNELAAEKVRFGMSRDYFWVRIVGRQEVDLLFRLHER